MKKRDEENPQEQEGQSPEDRVAHPETADTKKGVDLDKRFHLRQGNETLVSFDTREEADKELEQREEHRKEVLAEASKFTHGGPVVIVDRGVRPEDIQRAAEEQRQQQ